MSVLYLLILLLLLLLLLLLQSFRSQCEDVEKKKRGLQNKTLEAYTENCIVCLKSISWFSKDKFHRLCYHFFFLPNKDTHSFIALSN